MLDYDNGVGLEHGGVEDQFRYLAEIFQVVGWIGEDYVKLFGAGLHKLEHIALDEVQIYVAEAFGYALDEPVLHGCFFDSRHSGAFT